MYSSSAIVTFFLFTVAADGVKAQIDEDEIYSRIFSEIDVDAVLNNDRLLDSYLKCFYGTGPCTDLAELVKGQIPEIFSTVCGSCSDMQKGIFKHSLEVFIPKRPDDWKHILAIYDPEGKYWPGIKEFMES